MVEILDRQLLAEGIWQTKVLAPRIAKSAKPGQFIIVRADDKGERVPLTIADYNAIQALVSGLVIGALTFGICAAGIMIGKKFGTKLENKAAIFGGVILIALGIKIFLEGIGVIG